MWIINKKDLLEGVVGLLRTRAVIDIELLLRKWIEWMKLWVSSKKLSVLINLMTSECPSSSIQHQFVWVKVFTKV